MYRVFLYFCDCDPEWIDLGNFKLNEIPLIQEFIAQLGDVAFLDVEEALNPNNYTYKRLFKFCVNLYMKKLPHSVFHYHDDKIEVFHVR